jgi:AcrR family transcriptional regulator
MIHGKGVRAMFEEYSKRNKAIVAALELAAVGGWKAVTFPAIADVSGVSLADLRRDFTCKTDILRAFQAEIDAEVLAKSKPATPEQGPRDRVFDMVMTRFEAMTPYKPALRRISAALCCHPAEAAQLIPSSLAAQYWMLAGAGAKLDGPGVGLRVAGLASIYCKVFGVWLDDDTPGLDRTMAALDRRLKNGEQCLSRVEAACESFCRLACGFMPRGWKRRETGGTAEPAAGRASANPASA